MYNLSHLIIAPLLTAAVLPSSAGEQLIGFVVWRIIDCFYRQADKAVN